MANTNVITTLEAAVRYLQTLSQESPAAPSVVDALIVAEKHSKQAKERYGYEQFLGAWRLGLVSGTQKVKSPSGGKPIKKPGKGRYLPRWVKIVITYADGDPESLLGTVENAVSAGPFRLKLTGPTRFWPKTNSLAFDFTHIQVKLGVLTVYKGAVRGGAAQDQTFEAQSLKDQAFFTFFVVNEDYIAARGKGGGLALWVRTVD